MSFQYLSEGVCMTASVKTGKLSKTGSTVQLPSMSLCFAFKQPDILIILIV